MCHTYAIGMWAKDCDIISSTLEIEREDLENQFSSHTPMNLK
jgi:hypothetical protein